MRPNDTRHSLLTTPRFILARKHPWRHRIQRSANEPQARAAVEARSRLGPVRGIWPSPAKGQPVSDKPNVLILWGDDIGQSNLSCYSNGLMGYRTPNIDRVAAEGVLFTDYYAEQSCTAGRAAFITGQNPYRTGLTKVGLPGAPLGLQAQDPTIATALKAQGYATGQFGKNHLGDRDEHLPTMHGFDEFFGNLYHLNAEEEPELPDYPTDPEFRKRFGPRGVLHTWANGDGTQRIEDTGPLTKKRMETCDDEFRDAAVDFIKRQHAAETPFFVWFNTTHMHFRTHTEPGSVGRAGRWQSRYHDTMLDHDDTIGSMLDLLDELGIAENTIVMYSTDNGPHMNSWPDAGMTPFRNEKNSNWEGAYRVPALVRWPGHIPAGSVLNGIVSHADWFVTLLSAAGVPDIAERLRAGTDLNGTSYKVHLDGHDQLAYITGETDESARKHFFYVSDDGDLTAMRFDNWKFVFLEQRCVGTLQIWAEPYVELRVPKLFNLRTDPYERADITSNTYYDWMLDHIFLFVPAQAYVAKMLETLIEFPQRQKSASFSMDQVMAKLQDATTRSS
jgi:arylsulfatase A-like enzyme